MRRAKNCLLLVEAPVFVLFQNFCTTGWFPPGIRIFDTLSIFALDEEKVDNSVAKTRARVCLYHGLSAANTLRFSRPGATL